MPPVPPTKIWGLQAPVCPRICGLTWNLPMGITKKRPVCARCRQRIYTVGRICLTRGSSQSNIGLLLRMLWVVVCFQSRCLTICKHGLFTANRWAKCPWNMPYTRMFTNCKESAWKQTTNHSIRNKNPIFDWEEPLVKQFRPTVYSNTWNLS